LHSETILLYLLLQHVSEFRFYVNLLDLLAQMFLVMFSLFVHILLLLFQTYFILCFFSYLQNVYLICLNPQNTDECKQFNVSYKINIIC
jgi:hypothetical protein